MNYDRAIEILIEQHRTAEGESAAALKLAIKALEEQAERREAEVDKAVEMVGYLLTGCEETERRLRWRRLRGMLKTPSDLLDEVERRLEPKGAQDEA